MNFNSGKIKNVLLAVLTVLLIGMIFLLTTTKNNSELKLELIKAEHEKKIQAIEFERDVISKEKSEAEHKADSLTGVVLSVPGIIYKNKIVYVEKIDSVLHLSSDKRVVYFTGRTRKGFRHK